MPSHAGRIRVYRGNELSGEVVASSDQVDARGLFVIPSPDFKQDCLVPLHGFGLSVDLVGSASSGVLFQARTIRRLTS